MRAFLAALAATTLAVSTAQAANADGPYGLAMAGVIAAHDPFLTSVNRHRIAALFAGNQSVPYPAGHHISVVADKVVCRVSNVQITSRSCQLTINGHTSSFTGASANAVFATLAAAGVPSDGAAGTIFEAVHGLSCTLTPSVIEQNAGGGAECAFSYGP